MSERGTERGAETILRELLALSERHVDEARDDRWEAWEETARRKEACYETLTRLGRTPANPKGSELLSRIQELEKVTRGTIEGKREDVRKALAQFRSGSQGARRYGRTTSGGSEGHFSFEC